jgi:uncharacterized membrane protein
MRLEWRKLLKRFRNNQVRVWLIPLAYAFFALTGGFTVDRIGARIAPELHSTISVSAAIGMYSAIASGMIALTSIVFSLTFLMVQFSATAYSPRLVLWVARDPVMTHALGVFTATFLYALSALAWVDRAGSGRVPLIGQLVMVALLVISVGMFISLTQRIGLLQVNRMLIFTGQYGREVIEHLYPPIETPPSPGSGQMCKDPCVQTLVHHGRPRIIQSLDTEVLIELAAETGSVVEMLSAVGDALLELTPVLRVYGGDGPLPEQHLRDAIFLGGDRTFEQDPKYAIRLLVDIAIKALSPAINDPTTAVQALDQIEDLLIRLGRRRLEIGAFRDKEGNLRLLVPHPDWDDFLRLSFDEISSYGASSVQVMRRMKALMRDLQTVLPEERRPALRDWQERLQSTINRTFTDRKEKQEASSADRQGIGISRRETETP